MKAVRLLKRKKRTVANKESHTTVKNLKVRLKSVSALTALKHSQVLFPQLQFQKRNHLKKGFFKEGRDYRVQ